MEPTYVVQRWVDFSLSGGGTAWADEPGARFHRCSVATDAAVGLSQANKGVRYRVLRVEVVKEVITPPPGQPGGQPPDQPGDVFTEFAGTEGPFLTHEELDAAFRSGAAIEAGACPDCGSELDRSRADRVKCKGCLKTWKRATLAPFGVGWFR